MVFLSEGEKNRKKLQGGCLKIANATKLKLQEIVKGDQ
jgi:hypothetical protein